MEAEDGGIVPCECCADAVGWIVEDKFIGSDIEVEGGVDFGSDFFDLVLEAGPVGAFRCYGLQVEAALVDVVVIEQGLASVDLQLLGARVRVGEGGCVEVVLRHEEAELGDVVDELEDDIGVALREAEVLGGEPPLPF